MKQIVKKLFCAHTYKEKTVILDEQKLIESCADCGKRRTRALD